MGWEWPCDNCLCETMTVSLSNGESKYINGLAFFSPTFFSITFTHSCSCVSLPFVGYTKLWFDPIRLYLQYTYFVYAGMSHSNRLSFVAIKIPKYPCFVVFMINCGLRMEEKMVFADISSALMLLQEVGGGKDYKDYLKLVNLFFFCHF